MVACRRERFYVTKHRIRRRMHPLFRTLKQRRVREKDEREMHAAPRLYALWARGPYALHRFRGGIPSRASVQRAWNARMEVAYIYMQSDRNFRYTHTHTHALDFLDAYSVLAFGDTCLHPREMACIPTHRARPSDDDVDTRPREIRRRDPHDL